MLPNEMPSMQKTSQACQRDQFLVFITSISDNSHSLLICTLISENQGLEKSRSVSNPRNISGSAFFQDGDLEKNQGLQNLKFV